MKKMYWGQTRTIVLRELFFEILSLSFEILTFIWAPRDRLVLEMVEGWELDTVGVCPCV